MFQSVIEKQGSHTGRLGTGALVSLMVHAGLLAGALAFPARAVGEAAVKEPELKFVIVDPAPPRGSPVPVAPSTPRHSQRHKRTPRRLVQPSHILPKPAEAPPAPEEPDNGGEEPGVLGGHPDGVEQGGVIGVPPIPGLQGPPSGGGTEVLPFGAGMTPPALLSGAPLQYTREALEARVRGTLVARCTITREGVVEGCRVLKGLPFMDEATLAALETRRYRPVHYQGRPVSVSYTFHVRLELP